MILYFGIMETFTQIRTPPQVIGMGNAMAYVEQEPMQMAFKRFCSCFGLSYWYEIMLPCYSMSLQRDSGTFRSKKFL